MLHCSPRNRLVYKHAIALQLGNLLTGLYFVKVSLVLKIVKLCLGAQCVIPKADRSILL